MQVSDSFNAGYRLGQLVRPLVSGVRDVLTSSTERQRPEEVDYTAFSATPAMVRRGVDLSLWQAQNLRPIDEHVHAERETPVYLLGWDGKAEAFSAAHDPASAPSSSRLQGPRSSLDVLI